MNFYTEWKARSDLLAAGKMVYDKGNLVAKDGNLSVRLPDGNILITCTGCCKGDMTMAQITKIDPEGRVLSGDPPARDYRMHLAVYKERDDIRGIVHTHAPVTTGFASSSFDVESVLIPEVMLFLGDIAFSGYATPATEEVPHSVTEAMRRRPASSVIVMALHGALAFDRDILNAAYKILSLDMTLSVTAVARSLGGLRALTAEQRQALQRLLHPNET